MAEIDVLLADRADLPAARGVRRSRRTPPTRGSTSGRTPTPRRGGPHGPTSSSGSSPTTRSSTGPTRPFAKWFVGGKLNASANCLDRHVDGRQRRPRRVPTGRARTDDRRARSPTPSCSTTTQRFANALQGLGVGKGDVVGIYLPMLPETAVGDARLRADRRDPQRRLRRLLGRARSWSGWSSPTPRRWSPPTRPCAAASRRR